MQGDINLIAIFLLILTLIGVLGKMDTIKTVLKILIVLICYYVLAFLFPAFRLPFLYDLLDLMIFNLLKLIDKIKEGLLWVCWH